MFQNKTILFVLIPILFSIIANADTIPISLNTFDKPASDLFGVVDGKNQKLEIPDLSKLYKAGNDLSILQPPDNSFWQNKKFTAEEADTDTVRAEVEKGVTYSAFASANRDIGLASLYITTKSGTKYGLTFGTNVHTSLLRAALLRKIGYFQFTPVFLKEVKVTFASRLDKEAFINTAFCGQDGNVGVACLSIDPFTGPKNLRLEPMLIRDEQNENVLIIRSAYIERFNPSVPSLMDGISPASKTNNSVYGSNRAFRALVAPFGIAEIGESLNRPEPEAVSLFNGQITAKINFGYDFVSTDNHDVRWALRKVVALNAQDWLDIGKAGQFPDQCLNRVALNWLIVRADDMVQKLNANLSRTEHAFKMPADVTALVKIKGSCKDFGIKSDLVKDGIITKEFLPGSPIRFSHGLRPSPFGKGDLRRILSTLVESSLLQKALSLLSKKITSEKMSLKGITKIKNGESKVLGQLKKESIGGNVDGFRLISTGTVHGSQAPVQLVDNVTLSVSATKAGLEEIDTDLIKSFGLSAGYFIEFTHVKPVASMQEARKENIFKTLNAPLALKKLASPLLDGSVSDFLKALKPNEVFTVTESFRVLGSYGFINVMESVRAFGRTVNPSISISIGAKAAIFRQTQFVRTEDGVQVIIRKFDPKNNNTISGNVALSGRLLMELFNFNYTKTRATYATSFYNLKYDQQFLLNVCPKVFTSRSNYDSNLNEVFVRKYENRIASLIETEEFATEDCTGKINLEEIEDDGQRKKYMQRALEAKIIEPGILQSLTDLTINRDSRYLETEFSNKEFKINNVVKSTDIGLKMFWNRNTMLSQDQVISFLDPILNDGSENTQPIQIAASKRGSLRGTDKVGFGLNFIDALMSEILGEKAISLAQDNDNPANMYAGSAEWKMAEVQTEITNFSNLPERNMKKQSASLQYVWGGWKLKYNDMMEIVDQINQRIPDDERAKMDLDAKDQMAGVAKGFVAEIQDDETPESGITFKNDGKIKLIPMGTLDRVDKIDFYRLAVNLKVSENGMTNLQKLFVAPDLASAVNLPPVEKKNAVARFFLKWSGRARIEDRIIFENIIKYYGADKFKTDCTILTQMKQQDAFSGDTKKVVGGTEYSCMTDWVERLIMISRKLNADNIEARTAAMSEVLFILEENLPIQIILKLIGQENYRYYFSMTGFRANDENAVDSEKKGPVFGAPPELKSQLGISLTENLAIRFNVSPIVLDRFQSPF